LSTFWIAHQFTIVVFLGVLLVIALSNLVVLRRLGTYPRPPRTPRVSILVPARNEEINIGPCLRSLLAQDYPDFEVIVLDDESQDRTGAIIAEIAAEDPRLRAITGKPLPPGWLGKHWACQQLGEAAGGELLLFTDADTRHEPHSVLYAVGALFHENADLLTAIPQEKVITFAEQITVPMIPWSILVFLPLAVAYRLRMPGLSSSIGQFMLFRRGVYEAVGGYASVRTDVVDDIAMGRRIKANGFRWRLANAMPEVKCRMYRNFSEAFEGLSKNAFASLGVSVPIFILVWLWMFLSFLEPLAGLLLLAFNAPLAGFSTELAAWAIGLSLLLWGLSAWRFGLPLHLTLFYPLIVTMTYVIAMRSLVLSLTGRSTWKGRTLLRTRARLW
jgi:chlorobactene glucosyltransferase